MASSTGLTPRLTGVTIVRPNDFPPDMALNSPEAEAATQTPGARKSRRLSREKEGGKLPSSASPRSSQRDSAPWDEGDSDDDAVAEPAAAEESDSDSDDEGSDAYLARMMQARQQPLQRAQQQQQRQQQLPSGSSSPGVRRQLPPTPPPEDGWDAAGPRKRGNGAGPAAEGEGGGGTAGGGEVAAAPSSAGASDGASSSGAAAESRGLAELAELAQRANNGDGPIGDCDEEDGGYYAAKDGSRRRLGKHSRSTLQSVKRGYAISARQAQRNRG